MTWHLAIGLLIKTHETEQSDFRRVIIFASASSDSALHWNNILYLTFLLPSQPLSHSPHRPLSRSMCYFLIYIYIYTGKFSLSLLVYAVLFFYIFKAQSFIYFCLLKSPLQLRHYSFFHFILLLFTIFLRNPLLQT